VLGGLNEARRQEMRQTRAAVAAAVVAWAAAAAAAAAGEFLRHLGCGRGLSSGARSPSVGDTRPVPMPPAPGPSAPALSWRTAGWAAAPPVGSQDRS